MAASVSGKVMKDLRYMSNIFYRKAVLRISEYSQGYPRWSPFSLM